MKLWRGIPALLAVSLTGCAGEAGAIGIIGGADGPTAVFVTTQVAPWVWGAGIIGVVAVGAVGFVLWRRHKK